MQLQLPDKIDKKQWSRFLGMKDEDLAGEDADRCQHQLMETARPQGFFVYSDKLDYPGQAMKKHLAGCRKSVIMGVTLGRSIDDLITKLEITDMKMAVLADTGASVLADMTADLFQEQIRSQLPEDMPYMTSRFSPGYGDFPLSAQRDIIRMLDAERKIGLTLNESNLMIPMKSVTAIAGISDKPVKGYLAGCDECLLKSKCEKRKEGRICGI